MTRLAVLLCAFVFAAAPSPAKAGPVVGVSWSHFQEERWKIDEAALRGVLEKHGARYLSADAQSSSEKQISDVETLIARGSEVLVVLAQDADAIGPAIALARAEGIPVIGYARLVDGQVDVLLDDPVVAASVLRRKGWSDAVARHPGQVHDGQVALMFSRASVPQDLVQRFQKALELSRRSGRIESVVARYVDQDMSGKADKKSVN